MCGIKVFIILPVAAFHFPIMAGSIGLKKNVLCGSMKWTAQGILFIDSNMWNLIRIIDR